jgi:hypothetical protein
MASGRWYFLGGAEVRLSLVAVLAALTLSVSLRQSSADPPADQEYTGSKRCGSCHFEQYTKWKKDLHSSAFALLTGKYKTDAKCLKCHTTGYGQPTGYKDAKSEGLTDIGCESCHGPGSKHEEISKPFAQVKNLTKEQEEAVRGSIWKVLPKNVCIECHTTKGHHDSETPPELKKKK